MRFKKPPRVRHFVLVPLLAGLLGLGAGVWLAMANPSEPELPSSGVQQPSSPPQGFSLVPGLHSAMNVLFMGTDVDDEGTRHGHEIFGLRGNTDTIMAVRFDPARGAIRILSIPRDTRVPIPGHQTFKINAANPYGGPELALRTVSDFLGTPIDRYVVINTRAIIEIVDAMGGVEVFVPKEINYDDFTGHLHIHLHKGNQHLDGQRAHDYVRFRHDNSGDIGRVGRQQAFVESLLSQYMTPFNLLKTPQLLKIASANLATNLSPADIMGLINWAKGLKTKDVQLSMIPGHEAIIRGGWYWVAAPATTSRLVNDFWLAQATETAKTPALYSVALEDGIGDPRAFRRLHRAVARAGYGGVELDGLADEQGQAETQIIAQTADVQGAEALAATLGVGKVVVAATGIVGADFTVVMGRDWAGTVTPSGAPSSISLAR